MSTTHFLTMQPHTQWSPQRIKAPDAIDRGDNTVLKTLRKDSGGEANAVTGQLDC